MSADGKYLYVASFTDDSVAVFARDPASGAVSCLEKHQDGQLGVEGLNGAVDVALSPDGAHVYVSSMYDSSVAVFSRNAETGRLTFVTSYQDGVGGVDGLAWAWGLTVTNDGQNVYVASRQDDAVAVFQRNDSTGELTFVEFERDGVGGVDGLDGAWNVTVADNGAYLYASGYVDDAVAVFERDGVTGQLGFLAFYKDGINGVDGLNGAMDVKIGRQGEDEYLYVSGTDEDAIAVFQRDTATGLLDLQGIAWQGVGGVQGLDGPWELSLSPDQEHLYATSRFSNAVTVFRREGQSGLLSFVETLTTGTGGIEGMQEPLWLTISPDGGHTYVTANSKLFLFGRARPGQRWATVAEGQTTAGIDLGDDDLGIQDTMKEPRSPRKVRLGAAFEPQVYSFQETSECSTLVSTNTSGS